MTLCSMGPGMMNVYEDEGEEEVVSWARAVASRARIVHVNFMIAVIR